MTSIPPNEGCPDGMKRCTRCKQCFPATLDYFPSATYNRDGLFPRCRTCTKAYKDQWEAERKANPKPAKPKDPDGMRRCSKCDRVLPATLEFFMRDTKSENRLRRACRDCMRQDQTEYLRKKPARAKTERKSNVEVPDGMKHCSTCHRNLPAKVEFFGKSSRSKDGLQFDCKECANAARREKRRLKNAQKPLKEAPCPDGMKRCRKCQQCSPATTEYFPRDAKGHGGLNYQCRTCANSAGRTYKRANPDKMALSRRIDEHRRRAVGKFDRKDVVALYKMQAGCCVWCSKPMAERKPTEANPLKKYTIDHIVPIKRGGSNWAWNIILACSECNLSRGKKWAMVEWQPPNLLKSIEPYLYGVILLELLWQYGRWWYLLGRV